MKNEKNEQHWRHLVLHLSQMAAEKGLTHQAIADALGMKRSNVSRFFAGNQCPTLRTFVAVARAVTEYEPNGSQIPEGGDCKAQNLI